MFSGTAAPLIWHENFRQKTSFICWFAIYVLRLLEKIHVVQQSLKFSLKFVSGWSSQRQLLNQFSDFGLRQRP